MFLIIPCGNSVRIKVTSLKKWKKVIDVTSATILKFNITKLKANDRIMIKFYPKNFDDGLQKSENLLFPENKTM